MTELWRLERNRRYRHEAKRRATQYVGEINARTVCANCGAQPIEWHNPEHVLQGRSHRRISRLVHIGAAKQTIQTEIDRCTPLCRRCHMIEDGRMQRFVDAKGARGRRTPIQKCQECTREYKPLRRGLCSRCYDRDLYWKRKVSA